MIAQFTEHTSAIKIRGNAKIHNTLGEVESEGKNKSYQIKSNCFILISYA